MANQTGTIATSRITKGTSTKNVSTGNIQLQDVIGMPPGTWISDNILRNSIPIAKITPCICNWADGLNLFQLLSAWEEYKTFLGMFGYSPATQNYIQVAFNVESIPSETFTNEFGQTFIAQMANVVGDAAGDLAQMSGASTAGGVAQSMIDLMKNAGGVLGGIGEGAQGVKDQIKQFGDAMSKSKNKFISRVPAVVDKLLGGQKVDFPQVWKNSAYAPNYEISVKLYCNNIGNSSEFEKQILGPLTAILALVLPQGQEETYKYPFFCKVDSPGLFNLPAAGISSVAIIKGGEGNLIGYNRKIGAIDLRITFQDLFTTLLMQDKRKKNAINDNRTNLKLYLDQMRIATTVLPVHENSIVDQKTESKVAKTGPDFYPRTPSKTPVDAATPPTDRAGSAMKAINDNLLGNSPFKHLL